MPVCGFHLPEQLLNCQSTDSLIVLICDSMVCCGIWDYVIALVMQ